MRVRLALLAVTVMAGMALVGPISGASAKTPQQSFKRTFVMNGKTTSGKAVKGKFTVSRYVRSKYTGRLIAIGTYKGTIGKKHFTRRNVRAVAKLSQPAGASAAVTCTILDLTIRPIDLFLLGLHVHTDTIHLSITGNSDQGLLGSLLCGIANLFQPTGLTNGQLAQLLNSLLGALTNPVG